MSRSFHCGCLFSFLFRCVVMNSKSLLAFSNRAMAYLKVCNRCCCLY